jgi:mono/diheme cytochrome c family protein
MIEKYVDAEELKRLVSSLIVFVGALTIAGLFASILVPGLRNANRPAAPMPVNPVVGEPGWLDPTEFPPERGRIIPPVDPKTLLVASPGLLAKGKDLFLKNCSACHGESGLGDGPASASLNPRARNFTLATGWTNGTDLPAIYRTVTQGVRGTGMAAFDYLSKSDRMALAHYVQSLGTFPHGTGTEDVREALSKELAAAGDKTPNRIPVSAAIAKLEQEFVAVAPLALAAEDHDAGAEIFRRVVMDPSRVSQTLAGSESWRAGVKEFAAGILPGTPGNGFSVDTATLNAAEWQALHAQLLKLLPSPNNAGRK